MAGKFEITKDKAGKYRFRLKAGNGEIIAVSEAYETIARCRYAGSRSPAPRGNASPSMSAARPTLRFVLPGPRSACWSRRDSGRDHRRGLDPEPKPAPLMRRRSRRAQVAALRRRACRPRCGAVTLGLVGV